jgi:capsular exopolysaccharide synthesis family protein
MLDKPAKRSRLRVARPGSPRPSLRNPLDPHRPIRAVLFDLDGTLYRQDQLRRRMAVGLAFFFEYIDNRIKTPDEIPKYLGLPFLGMIPALFNDKSGSLLINNGVPANFSESFRTLRTNVVFSSTDEGLRSVVVTSTAPNEGKTVVATNLAVGLAQAGLRVLLIDADMRRPRTHLVFDKTKQPGLSNVLVGATKLSAAVVNTAVPGLWLLPAGTEPPNPSELLGSKRFADLMESLQRHFDWVIIDTPPIMAVTDSAIVAHLVTGVIFVVGAEMTNRYAAQRAVAQLSHGRTKFVGAVLNRVDLKHHSYYYSQYYRRAYSDYYANHTD